MYVHNNNYIHKSTSDGIKVCCATITIDLCGFCCICKFLCKTDMVKQGLSISHSLHFGMGEGLESATFSNMRRTAMAAAML